MIASRYAASVCSLALLLTTSPAPAEPCTDGCVLKTVSTLPSMQRISVVAIGDANNDGRADIVGVGENGDYGVNVYLQAADGSMQQPVTYFPTGGGTPYPVGRSVAIGDMNGDGRNDIVVTTEYGSDGKAGIRVMHQNSQGTFGAFTDYATDNRYKLRLVDINRDGRLDVVSMGGGSHASVFLQNTGGTLDTPTTYGVTYGGSGDLDVADVNNDGLLDIVITASASSIHEIAVLAQTSAGGFASAVYYDTPNHRGVNGVGVGDINGDGRNDVVVSDASGAVLLVYLQNASGTLNAPVSYGYPQAQTYQRGIEIVDMNQDGRADLVVLNDYGVVQIYLQQADGTLGPELIHHTGRTISFTDAHGFAVRDLNGDGKPDVVVAAALDLTGVHVHYATRANLRMTMTADQTSGIVDKPINYTVTIVNEGPDVATDVRFSTTTPTGMFTSGYLGSTQGKCDGLKRLCALGAMAPGQSATITFGNYAYETPGTYTVTGSVIAYTQDNDMSDNTRSVAIPIEAGADLYIYAHSVYPVASGQVEYYVTVLNDGSLTAQDVAITDTLPAGATPVSASWREIWGGTRSGGCQIAGNQVQCNVGTLAVTDIFSQRYPVAMTVRAQVGTSDNIVNTASVGATTLDHKLQNNTSARLSTAGGSAINQAPVIAYSGPYTVRLGAESVLDARGTRDPEASWVTHEWEFPDGSRTWSSGDGQARYTFNAAGTYPVIIRATDESGLTATQTVNITVVDTAPVAVANSPYYLQRKNAQVVLDARRSYDVDGGAVTYSWDFGDGTTGTGGWPFHTYTQTGEYTARVTVSDGSLSSSATSKVVVFNTPPSANAGGYYYAQKNEAITFDGTYSSDGNNDPLTYRWDFGDGMTGTGVRPVHTYGRSGIYTIKLIVNDGEADSAPAGASATVTNNAPVANGGGPYTVVKGQSVTLDGSASYDPDSLDTLTYKWNFGDGTIGSGVKPTHVYTKNGRFSVTLTVNDGEVDSNTYKTTVEVKNR